MTGNVTPIAELRELRELRQRIGSAITVLTESANLMASRPDAPVTQGDVADILRLAIAMLQAIEPTQNRQRGADGCCSSPQQPKARSGESSRAAPGTPRGPYDGGDAA